MCKLYDNPIAIDKDWALTDDICESPKGSGSGGLRVWINDFVRKLCDSVHPSYNDALEMFRRT